MPNTQLAEVFRRGFFVFCFFYLNCVNKPWVPEVCNRPQIWVSRETCPQTSWEIFLAVCFSQDTWRNSQHSCSNSMCNTRLPIRCACLKKKNAVMVIFVQTWSKCRFSQCKRASHVSQRTMPISNRYLAGITDGKKKKKDLYWVNAKKCLE